MVAADEDLGWMGRSAVHYGALHGDAAGVRAALEGGADPGLADQSGMTPFALRRPVPEC